MARRRLLVVAAVSGAVLAGLLPVDFLHASANSDDGGSGETTESSQTHGWKAIVSEGEVVLSAETVTDGAQSTPIPFASNPRSDAYAAPQPVAWSPHDPCPGNVWINGACWTIPDEDPDPASPVTISDFVSFAPAAAAPSAEPGAVALRNLHTNFIAAATTHTRTGQLLGLPASAEFTPVAYEWHYGDGSSRMVSSQGATWAQLGLQEFDPTPTSHRYTAKGTYTVTLITHYAVRAAYASDGQWWSVPGTLAVASAPLDLQVVTIKTVLVDKDCTQDPTGPGC